ncbi:hypothetical protein DSECCO2_567870 [anaerobic digester metagenome]
MKKVDGERVGRRDVGRVRHPGPAIVDPDDDDLFAPGGDLNVVVPEDVDAILFERPREPVGKRGIGGAVVQGGEIIPGDRGVDQGPDGKHLLNARRAVGPHTVVMVPEDGVGRCIERPPHLLGGEVRLLAGDEVAADQDDRRV